MNTERLVRERSLLRQMVVALHAMRLYPEVHPQRKRAEDLLRAAWLPLGAGGEELTFDFIRLELWIGGRPVVRLSDDSVQEIVSLSRQHGFDGVRLSGVRGGEDALAFLRKLAEKPSGAAAAEARLAVPILDATQLPGYVRPGPAVQTGPLPGFGVQYRAPAVAEGAAGAWGADAAVGAVGSATPTGTMRAMGIGAPEAATNTGPIAFGAATTTSPVSGPLSAVETEDGQNFSSPGLEAVHLLGESWNRVESQLTPLQESLSKLLRFIAGTPGDGLSSPAPLLPVVPPSHPALPHAVNTARLAALATRALGQTGVRQVEVVIAALFADCGMLSVPRELIERSATLNREEFLRIRQHPLAGSRRLFATPGLPTLAALVAFEHHLRPDGRGYPAPPKAWTPHPASRLVQACDAYAALRTDRAYRKGMGENETRALMRRLAGSALDKDAVEVLLTRAIPAGTQVTW